MRHRLGRIAAAVLVALVLVGGSWVGLWVEEAAAAPPLRAQQGPRVTGAGSTWSANAIDQWRADVARFGLEIEYQAVGSSAGRQFYIQRNTDFAVSEIPFEENELGAGPPPFVYMPIVAGGTALMYNVSDGGARVENLKLSASTLAKIFTGQIKKWDDPAITADNGRVVSTQPLTPVIRSDGSGTSAQFSAYLSAVAPGDVPANFFGGRSYTSNWPPYPGSVAQAGSDGVANFVANPNTGPGSITYVETSYAIQRGFPVAAVRNASGTFTLPTSPNVATALTQATINADRTQNLDAVYVYGDPNTYPISSYSYAIMPAAGFDPAKGEVLSRFVVYFICDGQAKAEVLGYSPLPANLQQIAFDAMREIPGAVAQPSIEECRRGGVGETVAQGGAPEGGGSGGGGGAGGTAASSGSGAGTSELADASLDPLGSGATADLDAARAADVHVAGTVVPLWPLLLAGVGLLAVVLVPPLVAGFRPRVPRRADPGMVSVSGPSASSP